MGTCLALAAAGVASGCADEGDQVGSGEPEDGTVATATTPVDCGSGSTFEITGQVKSPAKLIETSRTTCRVATLETLARQYKTSTAPSEIASALASATVNGVPSARPFRSAIRQACLTELLEK